MQDDRIIDLEELLRIVPISRSTVWRLGRQGKFPRPIKLGLNRVGWRLSEIREWLDGRPRSYGLANGAAAMAASLEK